MKTASGLLAVFLVPVAAWSCAPGRELPSPRMGDPLPGLTASEVARFDAGKAMFMKVWRPEDGLGPVYNENTCNACHSDPEPGGGGVETDEKVTALSADGGCDLLTDEGGANVRQRATALAASSGVGREAGPPGTRGYFTPPLLYGRGLMEATPKRRSWGSRTRTTRTATASRVASGATSPAASVAFCVSRASRRSETRRQGA